MHQAAYVRHTMGSLCRQLETSDSNYPSRDLLRVSRICSIGRQLQHTRATQQASGHRAGALFRLHIETQCFRAMGAQFCSPSEGVVPGSEMLIGWF